MGINRSERLAYIALFFVASAMAISASSYHGLSGIDDFSPTNHFISELGNRFKSNLYFVHNAGFIAAGVLLSCATLAIRHQSPISSLFLTLTSVGITAVGLVPEYSNIVMHLAAAILIFAGSVCGITIVAFQYLRNSELPCRSRVLSASVVTLAFFVCLIIAPKQLLADAMTQQEKFVRPSLWLLAIAEWGYFAGYTVWLAFFLQSLRLQSTRVKRLVPDYQDGD